jgi:hypothetical protein
VEGWTNLIWTNEIYSCDVCGGTSGSPSNKTEAFVFKREAPGFGFGFKPKDLLMVKLEELHRIWMNSTCLAE